MFWLERSRVIYDMIVRVVDYDNPFWRYGFSSVRRRKLGMAQRRLIQAIFESINGMVMDSFCCLTLARE